MSTELISRLKIRRLSVRHWLSACLVWIAFALLGVFYGPATNVMVFFTAVALLIVALSLFGATQLAARLFDQPWSHALIGLSLIAVVVSYQFSLSKDSSFMIAWGVMLVPMGYLVGIHLSSLQRWWIFSAISALVLCYAVLSVWHLVVDGDRASLPLVDSNNYACLLYLIVLPWLYRILLMHWQDERTNWLLQFSRGGAIIRN